jgi:hypothetical protein
MAGLVLVEIHSYARDEFPKHISLGGATYRK